MILLGAGLLGLLTTPDLRGGLGVFKAYFVEPIIFFYLVVDALRRGVLKQKNAVLSLILAAVWLSVIAVMQVFVGWFVVAPHEAAGGRAHAVFNSANSLALFIGPVIPLVLGYELLKEPKKDRVWRSLVYAYLLLVLWLTRSRGGVIAITMAMVFVLAFQFLSFRWLRRLLWAIFLGYLVGQVVVFSFVPVLAPKVDNPWQRPSGTEAVRLCVWEGTLDLLKDNWFLGSGLSGFKELYSTQYSTCDAEPLEYPHNILLNFWTETGLLGLLSFLSIIIMSFQLTLRVSLKAYVKWGVLAGLVYWLTHGLVDVPYFKNDLSLLFWTLSALLFSVDDLE